MSGNIGQLFIAGFNGKEFNEELEILLEKYNVGGVILFKRNIPETREKLKKLIRDIKQKAHSLSNPPPFVAIDHEGGRVHRLGDLATHFPPPGSMELLTDEEVHKIFLQQGAELAFYGFNMVFAPVLDLCPGKTSGAIGDRSFGTDINVVLPRIMASKNGLERSGIISVPKHFPGHGDVVVDPHFKIPVINKSIEEFDKYDLLPFKNIFLKDTKAVMTAHILTPQMDQNYTATLSSFWMDYLRNKMKFDGAIVSDDLCMKAIWGHNSIEIIAQRGAEVGIDLFLICYSDGEFLGALQKSHKHLSDLYNTDDAMRARMDLSLERIKKLKKNFSDIKSFDNENIFVQGHDFLNNIKGKC